MPPPIFFFFGLNVKVSSYIYSIHDPLSRAAFTRRFSVAVLNEALENRTPSEQRILIGETLYPLVELLEPNFTEKITGMLLELDRTQIFKLVESPEALKEKENIQYGTCEKCEEAKTGFETHDDCETYSLSDPRLRSGHPSTKPTQLGVSVYVVTCVSLFVSDS
ncbi:hypothetical protein YC2023_039150 [Brassica napus]